MRSGGRQFVRNTSRNLMKLLGHRPGLPGNVKSFYIVPLDPAHSAGLAGHLPVKRSVRPPVSWRTISFFVRGNSRYCFVAWFNGFGSRSDDQQSEDSTIRFSPASLTNSKKFVCLTEGLLSPWLPKREGRISGYTRIVGTNRPHLEGPLRSAGDDIPRRVLPFRMRRTSSS